MGQKIKVAQNVLKHALVLEFLKSEKKKIGEKVTDRRTDTIVTR